MTCGSASVCRSIIASLLFGVADDALYRLVNFRLAPFNFIGQHPNPYGVAQALLRRFEGGGELVSQRIQSVVLPRPVADFRLGPQPLDQVHHFPSSLAASRNRSRFSTSGRAASN